MKKRFYILVIALLLFSINVSSKTKKIKFNNVNTLNFKEIVNDENIFRQIKKFCTYEFCDYAKGDNIENKLYNFEESYFSTLNNMDIINELKVKGVKITEIYLF